MEFKFVPMTAATQKENAMKVAAARGWTVLADANTNKEATQYGWSFLAKNRQGKTMIVLFNSRSDWKGENPFPYPTMDQNAFSFSLFKDSEYPVFVCETNSDATRCVIAKEDEFGNEYWRYNRRTGKYLKVRSFANPDGRVVNVNLI